MTREHYQKLTWAYLRARSLEHHKKPQAGRKQGRRKHLQSFETPWRMGEGLPDDVAIAASFFIEPPAFGIFGFVQEAYYEARGIGIGVP